MKRKGVHNFFLLKAFSKNSKTNGTGRFKGTAPGSRELPVRPIDSAPCHNSSQRLRLSFAGVILVELVLLTLNEGEARR